MVGGTPPDGFRTELEGVINSWSKENGSNTPDFILATYLVACLKAFDEATKAREAWYKKDESPQGTAGPSMLERQKGNF